MKFFIMLMAVGIAISTTAAEYVVRNGAPFSGIAKTACISQAELRRLNPAVDADRLRAGQKLNSPAIDYKRLFSAFVYVESRGDNNAVGDNGKALGCLQMWPIMVDEVNRLIGKDLFNYKDRLNRERSYYMFIIIMNRNKVRTVDDAVRIWNPKYRGSKYRDAYRNRL